MTDLYVKNLTLSYGEKTIVSNFSHDFSSVGTYAFMGNSGSGKTTLLNAFAGLLKPNSGSLADFPKIKKSILFQDDRLLPWLTVLHNVAIVSDEDKAKQWLDIVELSTKLDEKPKNLSGGQKRRVAIARACAFGGDILLIDEPFTGLDEELKLRLAPKIKEAFPHIIFSTHDEAEVSLLGASIISVQSLT